MDKRYLVLWLFLVTFLHLVDCKVNVLAHTEKRLQAAYGLGDVDHETPLARIKLVRNEGDFMSEMLASATVGYCFKEHLQLFIDKSPFSDMDIDPDSVYLRLKEDIPSCKPVTSSNWIQHEDKWMITTLYSNCLTKQIPYENSIKYTNEIVVQIGDWNSEGNQENNDSIIIDKEAIIQTFECLIHHPTKIPEPNIEHNQIVEANQSSHTGKGISLDLFSERDGSRWVTFPRSVPINKPIFAQLNIVSNTDDEDLRAVPVECFVSGSDDRFDSHATHHMLIVSGCPLPNEPNVALVHDKTSAQYWFTFQVSTSFSSNFLFVHCKSTVCSVGSGRQSDGYKNVIIDRHQACPSSRRCSTGEFLIKGNSVPVKPEYVHVFAGPISPVIVSQDGLHRNNMAASNAKCGPCPTQNEPIEIVEIIDGIQVYVVGIIAFIAFILGALLVAGLWTVHTCTSPERALMLYAKRRNSHRDGDSSLASFSTPITTVPI